MSNSTPPWRYGTTLKSARAFSYFLAAVNSIVSFKGLQLWGFPLLESITLALLVLLFQACVGILITSGVNVGAQFEEKFFSDEGAVGGVKRVVGVSIIVIGVSFYIFDIATNYAAFTAGQPLTLRPEIVPLIMAVALSIGDEVLHIFADLMATNESGNSAGFSKATDDEHLQALYLRARRSKASKRAREQGQLAGDSWSFDENYNRQNRNNYRGTR